MQSRRPKLAMTRTTITASLVGLRRVRLLSFVLLPLWLLAAGCDRDEAPNLLRERHLGKVQAERDTQPAFALAAEHFGRVIAADPQSPLDHLNFARTQVFTPKGFAEALAAATTAEKLYGDEVPAPLHYVTGLCLVRLERYDEAAERFAVVTDMLPEHTFAWYQRGNAEARAEKLEAAAASFDRVLEIVPGHRAATYRAARVARRLNQVEKARSLDAAFKKLPDDKADKEKCDLTRVTLRPFERAKYEPPRVKFSWRDVTADTLGAVTNVSSVYATGAGPRPDLLLFDGAWRIVRSTGTGATYAPTADGLSFAGGNACLVGDFDNDGSDDVYLPPAELYRGNKAGTFDRSDQPTLRAQMQGVEGRALFDIDHDGDLDILGIRAASGSGGPIVLVRNNGDLTFGQLPDTGATGWAFAAHDMDQANDLDLVVAGPRGVTAHLNRRDGTFSLVSLLPADNEWRHVLVEDLDNDGAPDVFAATASGEWTVLRNLDHLGASYRLRMAPAASGSGIACAPVHAATIADLDNDGDVDVVLVGANGVSILRNAKGGRLQEEPVVAAVGARNVATADVTGDGMLELLIGTDAGLRVFASGASPRYESFVLRPDGAKDNDDGAGVIVEVYGGRHFQSRLVAQAGGLHLGLGAGGRGGVEGLLVRWPNGIRQAGIDKELVIEKDGACRVPQKSGESASCPFLYCQGPDGWNFVTDVLGIAPLGEWTPKGVTGPLDPEEFVRIEGDLLAVRDGKLRLAVTEELRETAYLDRLELIAIDHPEASSLFVDESTRQGAYDPLHLYVIRNEDLASPAKVELSGARTVTESLRNRDLEFVHPYADLSTQMRGWVPPHTMELTTAAAAQTILLTGRVSWYDSGVAYSAHQSGKEWGPLRLEKLLTQDAIGSAVSGRVYEELVPDLGLPAGMDRTIVCDLQPTGELLAAGSQLRITGHHRLLWDQVQFASQRQRQTMPEHDATMTLSDGTELVQHVLQVAGAELAPFGYARISGDTALHEETYHFEDNAPNDDYGRAPGMSTRYGDVTPLLHAHDDQLVVIVTGDAVEVTFDAPPAPASGAQRTYFLRVSGWAKETAYHNQGRTTLEPLPFRAMSAYPPAAAEAPRTREYLDYLQQYQTRPVR
ncbi:MAG: FG-GAP-like repeat-containing protein [Planctomycetota bacterium]